MLPEEERNVQTSSGNVDAGPLVVPVALASGGYEIHIGAGLVGRLGELCPPKCGARAVLVSSDRIPAEYADRCMTSLRAAGWAVEQLAVPDGEGAKSLAQAERLYEGCLDAGLDRGATVFALGGGVVGDLSGFVAATFMRGIAFVPVPTTLLSQVDASVGGKTAIDLPRAKNLVGAFHQPALVVADVSTLSTLPAREYLSGMAEVVKHAAIADEGLFRQLEGLGGRCLLADPSGLARVVARNCEIKARVVAADAHETGVRACLNFGHTIGHALEAAASGWSLRHGEAVALGMVAESEAAVRLGLASPEVPTRLRDLLRAQGLALHVGSVDLVRAHAALAHDKKVVNGRLRLPLVPCIGEVTITEGLPVAELAAALDGLLRAGA
jgi:3-dehydroquinate synthase